MAKLAITRAAFKGQSPDLVVHRRTDRDRTMAAFGATQPVVSRLANVCYLAQR
jgi:hypothetical protein